MSIEEDIQQSKFRNEHQKLLVNILFTCNKLNEQVKGFLDDYEVTSQQFNILRILRGAGAAMSTLQIRSRMLDRMSDTSRIVDRMVIKQLVKKSVCPADKRLVDVMITPKGLKLLSKIDESVDKIDLITAVLSDAEAAEMNRMLDKLRGSQSHD